MGYGCTMVFSALGGAGSNYLQGADVYIQRSLPEEASCYRHLQAHNKTVEKFVKNYPTVYIYRINGIPASLYPRCSVKR